MGVETPDGYVDALSGVVDGVIQRQQVFVTAVQKLYLVATPGGVWSLSADESKSYIQACRTSFSQLSEPLGQC
jgi:hypothetical protein